ncbi:MAG TPA: hypothetical protein VIR33_01865 [Thermopolyspora sp.]|jgi:hypothetical protein
MIDTFAHWLIAGALLVALVALITTMRRRPMGVLLLAGLALLEVVLLVQSGIAVAKLIGGERPEETATFIGYLVGTLVIPPFAVYWGLAERSRWGALVGAVGCLAIAAMVGRLLQLWQGIP